MASVVNASTRAVSVVYCVEKFVTPIGKRPTVCPREDDERQEERVPARDERQGGDRAHRRARQRQEHRPVDPEWACPVQDGCLLDLARNGREEGTQDHDRQRQRERGLRHRDSKRGVEQLELPDHDEEGKDRHGDGEEQSEREEGVHGLPATKREPCDDECRERRGGQDEEQSSGSRSACCSRAAARRIRTRGRSRSSP